LRQEERRIEEAEKASAAVASRTRSKSKSLSPTSTRIPLPAAPDSTIAADASLPTNPQQPTPISSHPTHGSIVGPGRRPSAISISSLQRPNIPLKLDLSPSSLRISTEEASLFSNGLASPVTLAPKSARAVGPGEFPPDFMTAFTSSTGVLNQPVDIDLTIPDGDQPNSDEIKMSIDPNIGSTADKPIQLDLDTMDIDMAITDIFGGSSDNSSAEASNTMDGLFSPVVGNTGLPSDFKSSKVEGSFLDSFNQPSSDMFASLGPDGLDHQSQQSKASPPTIEAAPSPGLLLANLSSPQLPASTSSNNAPGESQFDLNAYFSSLTSKLFSSPESDLNFSMDISDFLDLGGPNIQQKEGS
jgi:hypothetical protein